VTPSPDPFAIDPLRLVPQTAVEKFLQEHITALTDELAAKDRQINRLVGRIGKAIERNDAQNDAPWLADVLWPDDDGSLSPSPPEQPCRGNAYCTCGNDCFGWEQPATCPTCESTQPSLALEVGKDRCRDPWHSTTPEPESGDRMSDRPEDYRYAMIRDDALERMERAPSSFAAWTLRAAVQQLRAFRQVANTSDPEVLHETLTALAEAASLAEDELAAKDRVLALAREMDGWYDETNHTHREFKEALFALLRALLSPTEEPTKPGASGLRTRSGPAVNAEPSPPGGEEEGSPASLSPGTQPPPEPKEGGGK
jgi:hypothetical protein